MSALIQGLAPGLSSTLCRLWLITRRDGLRLGFTDHDCDLVLEDAVFRAGTGFTASALQQATGLSVDNSEASGALSDLAISEADLSAGRYDGAELRLWLVDWQDPGRRHELFRGSLGEITRQGQAFSAELRGLSEPLSQPSGAAYTRACPAVLGDARCGFDLLQPGYHCEIAAEEIEGGAQQFRFASLAGFEPGWFASGRLEVLSGAAAGLHAMIKSDRQPGDGREISLWQSIRAEVRPGDQLRLLAGCDKRPATCRHKFGNFLNYQGFPHLPGDDWLTRFPQQGMAMSGGSLTGPVT